MAIISQDLSEWGENDKWGSPLGEIKRTRSEESPIFSSSNHPVCLDFKEESHIGENYFAPLSK